jgi:hypothetical protein
VQKGHLPKRCGLGTICTGKKEKIPEAVPSPEEIQRNSEKFREKNFSLSKHEYTERGIEEKEQVSVFCGRTYA